MRRLVFLLLISSLCFFTMSKITDNNFKDCKKFFLNEVPPDFTPPAGVSLKPICQCLLDDNDEVVYLYATLYSTSWRIPVYSAYVYSRSKSIGRCDVWYIEPQLDGGLDLCMLPKGSSTEIGKNQAVNKDYKGSQIEGYDKGHLYPVLHTNNHLSMLATSTLTNAAPQKSTFNQKAWRRNEEAVMTDLNSCDNEAYVVTGVVPDMDALKLKNRVYVSKYFWSATCCLNGTQYTEKAYYGPDEKDEVKPLTIEDLNKKLQELYNVKNPISIFPGRNLNRKRGRE